MTEEDEMVLLRMELEDAGGRGGGDENPMFPPAV
jgi:hypothetical protein